jgi:hypothetical protein
VRFLPLKTCITNFISLDVSRVTGFHEFPNTSPSGKRVDSDDPIPRTFRNFSKNVTLGTSEGTRVTREPRNGRIEARSQNYPAPLTPINRRLLLLKFFIALLLCCELYVSCSSVRSLKFSSNFSKVLFSLSLNSCLFFPFTGVLYFANFIHERRLYFLLSLLLPNRCLESKVLQDP